MSSTKEDLWITRKKFQVLETVYKQNIKMVGWANQRFIWITHQVENFAHPTKLACNVSLTNILLNPYYLLEKRITPNSR